MFNETLYTWFKFVLDFVIDFLLRKRCSSYVKYLVVPDRHEVLNARQCTKCSTCADVFKLYTCCEVDNVIITILHVEKVN